MTGVNFLLIAVFGLLSTIAVFSMSIKHRWKALLVTSLVFYYIVVGNKVLIVFTLAAVIYFFSRFASFKTSEMWSIILLLLVPLLIYKFTNENSHFINYQAKNIDNSYYAGWFAWFQVIGISYFTFNAISYLVDLKRNYIQPEKNFFILLLYLIYFPAIFSGPLHRAKYMLQQMRNIEITENSISRGFRLMLWGFFKNVVIAQRIFSLMTQMQNSGTSGKFYLLIGLLFFLYLYCNFSSFIDFFQGVSKVFNIQLKDNFKNRIYLSSSRQEFWKGWHITLNEWFRDYFFFVISKYDKKRSYVDIMMLMTFILIALWHELSLVLLIWGAFNGFWIVLEKKVNFTKWPYQQFREKAGVVYHLFGCSILALIFISPDVSFFYDHMIVEPSRLHDNYWDLYGVRIVILIGCFSVMDFHYSRAKGQRIDDYLETKSMHARWFFYMKLTLLILVFGLSAGIDNYYIMF